jgi:hypothetical protein
MKEKMNIVGRLTAVSLILILFIASLSGCGGQMAPETDSVADQPDQPASAPDTSNLPPLPVIGTGNRGMGGGGGGEAVPTADIAVFDGDAPVDMLPILWNPLEEATFTINVPFPGEPTQATVYQQPGSSEFSVADIQRYAQLFGLNGSVYREVYPEPVYEPGMPEDMRPWTPPTAYHVFDGPRQLSVYDNNIYYFNQTAVQQENLQMMPYAQAAPIVEAFLKERGLLDFPYVTASPWGSDVEIRRIVNGYPAGTAEFYVAVTEAGDIMSVSYQPFDKLQAIGDYPLRSAADAWQHVQENGFDYMTSYWFTSPGPDAVPVMETEPYVTPWDEYYRYWPRTFNDGDPIAIVSYPMVYLAANGDAAPRILLDQYLLNGSAADLEALAEYAGQPVRAEGVVRGQAPNLSIDLNAWRPEPDQVWQYMPGTIRYDGGQVYFDADEGETFIVPAPPADVADGERVNLSGWSLEEGDGAFRVFNWVSMDRIVDWESLPRELTEPAPMDMGEEYKITDVTITGISLVYQFAPVFDEQGYVTQFVMQPAWRFSGTTNNANELIEIMVQAAAPAFVESPSQ